MKVILNDQEREVEAHATLSAALEQLGVTVERGIAVALNDRVVRRDTLPQINLQPNDRILIITATQGG